MRSPSPRAPDYGAQTLAQPRRRATERSVLFARPWAEDVFAAVGHLGQYVIVSPEPGG